MRARAGVGGVGGEDDEGVEEHGGFVFFVHGLARIERDGGRDSVAKLRVRGSND